MWGLQALLVGLFFVQARGGVIPGPVTQGCSVENCQGFDGTCYLPHPTSCFNFVMCEPAGMGFLATVRPCAFGTMWKPDKVKSKSGCDKPKLAACPMDPCRNRTVQRYSNEDSNCRQYWTCENDVSVPACCNINERFIDGECVPDPTCDAPCLLRNEELCRDPTIKSYKYATELNCRSYIRCENGTSIKSCCEPGHRFFNGTCIQDANCDADCFECKSEAVPNFPQMYKNLDAHGGQEMSCAVGTIYDPMACLCVYDPSFRNKARQANRECKVALHVTPPDLTDHVTSMAVLELGDFGGGQTGVGNMTSAHWTRPDGGLNVPFFGGQSLGSFALEITFNPDGTVNNPLIQGLPRILLSSCVYIAGIPSLEIRLVPAPNNTGVIYVTMASDIGSNLQTSLQYEAGVTYDLKVIYDGETAGVFMSRKDAPAVEPLRYIQAFSGNVDIDRSGLRFAHCRYEEGISSFIGTVDDIKFSKCVTADRASVLYPTMVP